MSGAYDRRDVRGRSPGDQPPGGHRYGRVAVLLHWLIAAAILFQIGLGWGMAKLKGLASFDAFQLHKSIGITVLVLGVVRVGWRLAHEQPAPVDQPRWMQRAAGLVHVGFYAMMIGLPLSGWIMVSTAKIDIPTLLFHTLPWPHLPILHGLSAVAKRPWFEDAQLIHSILVYMTLALLALHVGGVIKHQLLDRDVVFDKMAPGSRPGWQEPRLWGAFALLFGAAVVGSRLYPAHVPAAPTAFKPMPAGRATGQTTAVTPVRRVPPSLPATAGAANEAEPPMPAAPVDEAVPKLAKPVRWVIASANSKLDFTASWSGEPIHGRFAKWTGDILFSPDALERSRLHIEVDLASAATGDSQRDSSLPTSDWFDVSVHPKAVWISSKITRAGNSRYHADGTLQLRGISKPLGLDFSLRIDGKHAQVTGTAIIDRIRYGVGQGQWAATDQVAAEVALAFTVDASAR